MVFPNENVPRWIIFLIDTGIVFFSLLAAYMLRFEFSIPLIEQGPLIFALPIYMVIRVVSFLLGRSYAGIIRFTGTSDSVRIFKIILGGSLLLALLNPFKFYVWDEAYFLPYTIIILDAIISSVLLIVFRLGTKMLYLEIKNPRSERQKVVIYGAGEAGVITKRTLDRDVGMRNIVSAFVDDDKSKQGSRMEGAPVYHTSQLARLLADGDVSSLIVSVQHPNSTNRRKVIETAITYGTKVLNVPPVSNWINGKLSYKQIKQVRIEDLLGRDVIRLDDGNIEKQVNNKTILVTGAAGSIGSGLVRQLAQYNPKTIIALDQAETPSYELELEMRSNFPEKNIQIILGDIRNADSMKWLFATWKFQVVFHAAAYKHVPLMELNPAEAVATNVLGTKILVDLCKTFHIETFVLISTDKAVNPTSIMGSSKRIAEMYTQAHSTSSTTKFITTRFGNVLGSNGSVIPLFKKQIEKGGPITVTHPAMTRYFMTIPEACQLVLEAGALGKGGEIFVFDMGEAVKIIDLAKSMVELSGLKLDTDIKIEITGMRPGEKLYEELLNAGEYTLKTHHPQIKIAQVRRADIQEIDDCIEKIRLCVSNLDSEKLVAEMKRMVPEFVSMNSEFSKFDTQLQPG